MSYYFVLYLCCAVIDRITFKQDGIVRLLLTA